ncbi:MAG TPA: FlgD immunoglobulin-like domain containing protein, partial [Candidatus Cloacimonadota bacterium]|nr:FlgD immunoglobulin-like domain containing protein [Candidatus Cloacimonadota bacterium]
SATAHTSLKIYNIKGQLVRKLLDQEMNKGSYHISWDGRDQSGKTTASGMYLFRLEHGGQSYTGKAVLMK